MITEVLFGLFIAVCVLAIGLIPVTMVVNFGGSAGLAHYIGLGFIIFPQWLWVIVITSITFWLAAQMIFAFARFALKFFPLINL